MTALIHTELPGLKLLSKGKVRDIYATSSPDHLLFVATDRISAYDVILQNGIPDKGRLLTKISLFWFNKLAHIIPNHFVTDEVDEMPEEVRQYKDQLKGRAMLVRKAEVVPLEAIFSSGSAWSEYKKTSTVHKIALPEGMQESQRFPEPLFTPSLKLYSTAAEYALSKGVILADTKFEFGLVPSSTGDGKELILIDEVLTPDSSRYWPLKGYAVGKGQPSFDKQYLRDGWLGSGPEGKEGQGWVIDESVVEGTRKRYSEAVEMLVSA
ncbi:phosphoribosylaminoimidazole-succinocarboxamide synthase [Coprinopsis sp. MPI-PUGE-AT-0042]|nr:phosphoribosylaminoimidazole-succinocarboxamide synthase [Coprinopsis sp. MPI-PUGE-AT-0042]